ncbi:DNA primase [Agrobacterium tumefaciens]|uniref:DNA primase n=1 Tax=Agrobacterium tumefaciens TaxID=358 RepID=A0AAW8LFW2_AGRTU|nr:DNA primase [Agrobacterium tumefaciens]MBP2566982.1 DNA primase [Agrobacterium tumefaciens]MDR6700558.1 DNA primase [Agrobacterium tumefaciens]MQB37818.1 DNA primase [Agrobacterium tumefaciens]NTA48529.1 DNA primase [Agrobacterium tumefaciens]TCV53044.1 DNA primase [Agrobacterium tumefaciens]
MRFSNSFLDEIRDRVHISDVIGRRVSWDKKKTNTSRGDYWACCPFHGEKSPSFHCEDRKGRYHCFGCGVSGDHFRFLTELEGLSFPEAVQQIADMAGISMPQPDPQAEKRERERTSLQDVMEMATLFFQDQLQTALGARARAYLRDRGLTGRTIETFRLGYAPDSRNALKEHLASKGVSKEQMEACGLVVHENVPVSYDRFRDRIMFPILSSREKVIAFGGRAMASDAVAKYLNSNETELFHKGNVLYNFARARRASQAAGGSVIAVEGYMDVIALYQAGVENAVAPLGTALTESQLDLLWKMSPQPILCFDGDGAGIRAANRAADLALPHIKPDRSVSFALLPDGKDPDDLVRLEGRAPFDRVLSEAKPLAAMIWSRETSGVAFDTPEKRAQLESRLRQIVAVIGDEAVRRFYQQDMRDRLNGFFQPRFQQGGTQNGNFRRNGAQPTGRGFQRNAPGRGGAMAAPTSSISDRLTQSGLVRGYQTKPSLRESVLAITIVNHPELLLEEYDEIAAIDYENRDLQRLWSTVLTYAAESAAEISRAGLIERLSQHEFEVLLKAMDQQVRNARLWTATEQAAMEDAREGYVQALSLHKRTKSLLWQKRELEREIAEATDDERGTLLVRALAEVQLEIGRMENQEAIIDGFGVMSGRVKGPAVGHG